MYSLSISDKKSFLHNTIKVEAHVVYYTMEDEVDSVLFFLGKLLQKCQEAVIPFFLCFSLKSSFQSCLLSISADVFLSIQIVKSTSHLLSICHSKGSESQPNKYSTFLFQYWGGCWNATAVLLGKAFVFPGDCTQYVAAVLCLLPHLSPSYLWPQIFCASTFIKNIFRMFSYVCTTTTITNAVALFAWQRTRCSVRAQTATVGYYLSAVSQSNYSKLHVREEIHSA